VPGYAFAGWSGACSGFGVCVVALNADLQVTATFGAPQTGAEWAVSLTGTTSVYPADVTSDALGNAYVTGYMTGSVDFGKGSLAAQGTDAFAAKYDSAGKVVWATRLGGTNAESGEGIAVSPQGDSVFVLGHLTSAGANQFGGALTGCAAASKAVVKLNGATGAPASPAASCFGGSTTASSYATIGSRNQSPLVLKPNGNLAFGVELKGTMSFGPFPLDINGSYAHWALGELAASDFSVEHAVKVGRSGANTLMQGVASHLSDGSVVGIGQCSSGLDVPSDVPGERVANLSFGTCIVKVEDGFSPVWARTFGNLSIADGVAVASNGDVIVAGSFTGTLAYGGTGVLSAVSQGDADGYVARLKATDGSPVWARDFGDLGEDRITGVAVDWTTGNIAIVGDMSAGLDFGDGPLPYTSGKDLFFVLLDANGNTLDSRAAGLDSATPEYASAVVAKPAGGFLVLGRSAGVGATAFGLSSTTIDYTFLSSLE
jgi:hypothetical protein